ncbi:cell wall-binding repeat-containing protein [Herbiconiux solani]|uniref:cell wall-binding repeat-containing protein n=1 Tax=Herbiconiux solani TaxID=661329 RepID=UPI0008257E5F|nr:cell wall-binding repeat-containing protein [Herbiconiux solani]
MGDGRRRLIGRAGAAIALLAGLVPAGIGVLPAAASVPAAASASSFASAASASASAPSAVVLAAQEDQVFDRVNTQRAANGLPPLLRDATIEAAAEEWANYMTTLANPLTHSPNDWRASKIPPGWRTNGENIAVGQVSADQVMSDWMASPGHRANILNSSYTRIGVGYVASNRGGMWVQIFGGYDSNPPAPVGQLTPGTPTISGTPRVGSVLTADPGAWGPGEVSLSYQWNAGGQALAGATGSTYLPDQTTVGRPITVTITGSRSGYASASRTSAATTAVTTPFTVDRVAGPDRYSGAVALSVSGYPDGAPVVYVATGTNYPDALSAGPAAAVQGGPLLLTLPDSLPDVVVSELGRLKPAKAVVVGGTASVSPAVEAQLRGLVPSVVRVAGPDRFSGSRALVDYAFGAGGTHGAPTAYISTGWNFPDALAAGAAGGHADSPVLLVDGTANGTDSATNAALLALHPSSVKIAGGPNSVSGGVATSLSMVAPVQRLAGADRYAGAVAVNLDAYRSASTAYLATGLSFPDALSGSALAGAQDAPLFVVPGTCVPRPVLAALTSLGVGRVVLIGGTATLAPEVQNLSACAS